MEQSLRRKFLLGILIEEKLSGGGMKKLGQSRGKKAK